MDFDRVNETQERYDPDGQVVRSTQTREQQQPHHGSQRHRFRAEQPAERRRRQQRRPAARKGGRRRPPTTRSADRPHADPRAAADPADQPRGDGRRRRRRRAPTARPPGSRASGRGTGAHRDAGAQRDRLRREARRPRRGGQHAVRDGEDAPAPPSAAACSACSSSSADLMRLAETLLFGLIALLGAAAGASPDGAPADDARSTPWHSPAARPPACRRLAAGDAARARRPGAAAAALGGRRGRAARGREHGEHRQHRRPDARLLDSPHRRSSSRSIPRRRWRSCAAGWPQEPPEMADARGLSRAQRPAEGGDPDARARRGAVRAPVRHDARGRDQGDLAGDGAARHGARRHRRAAVRRVRRQHGQRRQPGRQLRKHRAAAAASPAARARGADHGGDPRPRRAARCGTSSATSTRRCSPTT